MLTNTRRPTLLYVSRVLPATTGNGLAMRAGTVLQALCAAYRVSVLIAPRGLADGECALPDYFAQLCEHSVVLPAGAEPADASGAFTCAFDVVHVFRLAAVPFARAYFHKDGNAPQRQLDLDDIESNVERQITQLQGGDSAQAAAEMTRKQMLESALLRFFNRVFVCSEHDRQELSRRGQTNVAVLPNVVRPPGPFTRRTAGPVFRFLFVATFGYYPNDDAAAWFCTEVLPHLGAAIPAPFSVTLVGSGISPTLQRLVSDCGVHLAGRVPDIGPWYHASDAAIVPLRAGGGTRIKILEAFSYRVPVVTTSTGVQGIEACGEEHMLVGDSPREFAEQCARLMTQPALGTRLAAEAEAVLRAKYTVEALERAITDLTTEEPRGRLLRPKSLHGIDMDGTMDGRQCSNDCRRQERQ